MAFSDDARSPVMNETLSVIEEHITDMNTPRQSAVVPEKRPGNDSGSEYSSNRLSYINGQETDEEEQSQHTETEVVKWSPAQVAEYLEDAGVEKKHCQIFLEQEINGEALLGMDQATIFLKEFELGPVGPRLRTWLKIKALQQEVKDAANAVKRAPEVAPQDEAPDSRIRSTSVGAGMPRITSLIDSTGSRTPNRHSVHRSTPPLTARSNTPEPSNILEESTNVQSPTTPTSTSGHTPRPSAAAVRSLGHARRHSSIDAGHPGPTPRSVTDPVITSPKATASPKAGSHKKNPSFDRNWSMGGTGPLYLESFAPGHHSMIAHSHSISQDNTPYDTPPGLNRGSPADIDRGYFSGGELDNRRGRNVLRKRDTPPHSRQPSYISSEGSRQSAIHTKRASRVGSSGSVRDSIVPSWPTPRFIAGGTTRLSGSKESSKPMMPAQDVPPTVTKLDYADSPSIDAIAASPAVPESENSSTGRASPSPGFHGRFFSKKSRGIGLRAISDAVTGNEKAMVSPLSDDNLSSAKESPVASPSRTGSSTPSGNSKSLELEDGAKGKKTSSSPGASAFPPRRKTKKTTSAYVRGLQQRTPKEQMKGCDYSGWMKKRSSNIMTTWKTRLFVLRGCRLSYYYTEFDTEEKGLIDISSHRVLPANSERITGIHAAITGATSSPSSPQGASIATSAAVEAAKAEDVKEDTSGMFIFKLVPPRSGLSKAVNFTKPTVHYFAVDNIKQGRLWMAALMKATIDRDENARVVSSFQQKTISLAKARAMRHRPPALMGDDDSIREKDENGGTEGGKEHDNDDEKGLGLSGLDRDKDSGSVADGEDSVTKKSTEPSLRDSSFKESSLRDSTATSNTGGTAENGDVRKEAGAIAAT